MFLNYENLGLVVKLKKQKVGDFSKFCYISCYEKQHQMHNGKLQKNSTDTETLE